MKIVTTLFLGAGLLLAGMAQALTITPYNAEELAKAQAAGAPVAIHFFATWCPVCRAQEKVLNTLKAEPDLNLTVMVADYDKEAELKKQLKVHAQSTFIVYRGKVEKNRQTGITSAEAIRATLRSAL